MVHCHKSVRNVKPDPFKCRSGAEHVRFNLQITPNSINYLLVHLIQNKIYGFFFWYTSHMIQDTLFGFPEKKGWEIPLVTAQLNRQQILITKTTISCNWIIPRSGWLYETFFKKKSRSTADLLYTTFPRNNSQTRGMYTQTHQYFINFKNSDQSLDKIVIIFLIR